eukprot:COSAG01_NODE_182_length_22838_cov_34.788733_1_plen_90_part_00
MGHIYGARSSQRSTPPSPYRSPPAFAPLLTMLIQVVCLLPLQLLLLLPLQGVAWSAGHAAINKAVLHMLSPELQQLLNTTTRSGRRAGG